MSAVEVPPHSLFGAISAKPGGAETDVIDMEPVMHVQLSTLAHASVLQLRDAIRRATSTYLPPDGRDAERFLEGVVVKDSAWAEWEETAFDVRHRPPSVTLSRS